MIVRGFDITPTIYEIRKRKEKDASATSLLRSETW